MEHTTRSMTERKKNNTDRILNDASNNDLLLRVYSLPPSGIRKLTVGRINRHTPCVLHKPTLGKYSLTRERVYRAVT
jgi:hypothetical protein